MGEGLFMIGGILLIMGIIRGISTTGAFSLAGFVAMDSGLLVMKMMEYIHW